LASWALSQKWGSWRLWCSRRKALGCGGEPVQRGRRHLLFDPLEIIFHLCFISEVGVELTALDPVLDSSGFESLLLYVEHLRLLAYRGGSVGEDVSEPNSDVGLVGDLVDLGAAGDVVAVVAPVEDPRHVLQWREVGAELHP